MSAIAKFPEWWHVIILWPLLVGCDSSRPDMELAAGEREIIELNLRHDLLEYRLQSRSRSGEPGTLHELDSHLDRLAAVRHTLENTLESLETETETLANDFEHFRIATLKERRRAAIGLVIDRMSTRDGRVFEDVTVTRVDDEGVNIRHRTGTATLRYRHLTDEQRATFGMDEELSLLAEQREHTETLAWHAWIENETSVRKQETLSRQREHPADLASTAAETISDRRSSPLAEPARPFGSGVRYRSHRPRYRTFYYYIPARPCQQPRHDFTFPPSPLPHGK